MSRNSTSSVGALHPVLFMLLVYVISIVLAFFVCRVVYFSIRGQEPTSDATIESAASVTAAR